MARIIADGCGSKNLLGRGPESVIERMGPMALISTKEAAARMGIAAATLRYWRMLHTGPPSTATRRNRTGMMNGT